MITLSTRAAAIAAAALTSVTAMVTAGMIAAAPAAAPQTETPTADSIAARTLLVPEGAEAGVAPLALTEDEPAWYLGNEYSSYVPVAPCRLVDTRYGGGRIAAGSTRDFIVSGESGFGAQGGESAGCDIPENAVAIAATLKAVAPSGSGYLKAWANGRSTPSSTALSYPKGLEVGDATIIPVGDPYVDPGISARAYTASTHLVVDVSGYYVLDDHGLVGPQGDLWSGGATMWDLARESTGAYAITLNHNIAYCSYLATPESVDTVASVTWDEQWNNVFHVTLRDLDGTAVDGPFHYHVVC